MAAKYVYFFDNGAEGTAKIKNQVDEKGANLTKMTKILPEFMLSTDIRKIEKLPGKRFGNQDFPLLFWIPSGARVSLPGMMDLDLDLNDVQDIICQRGDKRFTYAQAIMSGDNSRTTKAANHKECKCPQNRGGVSKSRKTALFGRQDPISPGGVEAGQLRLFIGYTSILLIVVIFIICWVMLYYSQSTVTLALAATLLLRILALMCDVIKHFLRGNG